MKISDFILIVATAVVCGGCSRVGWISRESTIDNSGASAAVAKTSPVVKRTVVNAQVNDVIGLINQCPSLMSFSSTDKQTGARMLHCFEEISTYKTETIRAAEAALYEQLPTTPSEHQMYMWLIFYALHRYLFNLPSHRPSVNAVYGAFEGVPVTKGERSNNLWPLAMDSRGRFEVVGDDRGYDGGPYQFLNEFDYFNSTYGRRKLIHNAK